jgi:soluble lytic murein transglycosylase-like protein
MYTYDDYDPYDQEDEVAPQAVFYAPRLSMIFPLIIILILAAVFIDLTSQLSFNWAAAAPPASAPGDAAIQVDEQVSANQPGASGQLATLFTPEVRFWENQIVQWAQEYQVDANLIAVVMQIESCGYQQALSRAGAMSLFQVMPYHFKDGENGFDVQTNALRGISYLKRSLLTHQGDVRLALAGYNGGIAGSQRPEENWPAETKRYVHWGMQIYQDAIAGQSHSDRLHEWLNAGGASLCRMAAESQK